MAAGPWLDCDWTVTSIGVSSCAEERALNLVGVLICVTALLYLDFVSEIRQAPGTGVSALFSSCHHIVAQQRGKTIGDEA